MKTVLTSICLAVLAVMMYVTVNASMQQDVLFATRMLWPDLWFRATLADAYFGFLFFWIWVAWREDSAVRGAIWFVLIMTLGNFAMAGYLLLQLRHLQTDDGVEALLLRRRKLLP
jgi:hypothetical protein